MRNHIIHLESSIKSTNDLLLFHCMRLSFLILRKVDINFEAEDLQMPVKVRKARLQNSFYKYFDCQKIK